MSYIPPELAQAVLMDSSGQTLTHKPPFTPLTLPDTLSRLVAAHREDPRFRAAIEAIVSSGEIDTVADSLLMERHVAELAGPVFMRGDSGAVAPFTWPVDRDLAVPHYKVPPACAAQSMAIVGDGPAAIMMARLRQELGYPSDATQIYSRSGRLGGIWTQDRVVEEGHNIHRFFFPLRLMGGPAFSTDEARPGREVQDLLSALAGDGSGYRVRKAAAHGITLEDGRYRVQSLSGFESFDSVLIATGNGVPKPIENGPMQTNAHLIDGLKARMKRWQETIPQESWESFDGSTPLMVGLGNSALAMLRQFVAMHREGVNIRPTVLTHRSRTALTHPDRLMVKEDGTVDLPAARSRSNLTKLSLDISAHRAVFQYALDHNWIIPSAMAWFVDEAAFKKDGRICVRVESAEGVQDLVATPSIFALTGYQNNSSTMTKFGAVVDLRTGIVAYDPVTFRVQTTFQDDPGRMYIAGAAASVPGNKNLETIPGMGRQMGELAFSEVVAGWTKIL